jgi:GDP-D-mannose dehydratase
MQWLMLQQDTPEDYVILKGCPKISLNSVKLMYIKQLQNKLLKPMNTKP